MPPPPALPPLTTALTSDHMEAGRKSRTSKARGQANCIGKRLVNGAILEALKSTPVDAGPVEAKGHVPLTAALLLLETKDGEKE